MTEVNFEAWKEIRGRVDSIANALFLVAGGALSVSIAVLLGKDGPKIPESAKFLITVSWYLLLYAVVAFVFIKGILVVQAYKSNANTPNRASWHRVTTWANWLLGISGLIVFALGMFLLVRVAAVALP
jgi:heme/copper-type cytochrome/quinol oxidase subunit 2